jgi:geranylgeranyl diphosphate synthase type I
MDQMDLISTLNHKAEEFNSYWKKYFPKGEPAALFEASWHLPSGGGKRLRPIIAMLTCESIIGNYKNVMPFAAALELIHNFTLVHDDIMDKSSLRRNLQTVHIKYSEPTAILAGDYLFAKAFAALYDLKVDNVLYKELNNGLVKSILDICEGQQLDMEFERRLIVTESEYLDMIMKKTAVLFQISSKGGALVANANQNIVKSMADFGLYLGISFQIWDDYLDLSSDATTLGKDIGNDIRNGKKTLIAVNALQNASGHQKELLNRVFGNLKATDTDIHEVFNLFKDLKSIEYARNTALAYDKKAKECLNVLDESSAKQFLMSLADFAIERET